MEFEFQGIEQSSEININIIKEIIDTKIKKKLCYKFKVLSGGKVPISSFVDTVLYTASMPGTY